MLLPTAYHTPYEKPLVPTRTRTISTTEVAGLVALALHYLSALLENDY
jgi:hypothetical protein